MSIYSENDVLSRAFADYLEAQDLGVFGEDLYAGSRPSSPTNCITIYDTGGPPPPKDSTSELTIEIISRNESYQEGLTKLHEIHEILKEKYGFWLKDEEIWIILLQAQGEPGSISRDKQGNYLFSANYYSWLRYY